MSKKWDAVADYLKKNAGQGVALVGSLMTGNVPGAIAAGVSLVSSATGSTDPNEVLDRLQTDPTTIARLRELQYHNEASIREHLRAIAEAELKDAQAEHEQTQITIRAGDVAEDRLVRWTRPLQSWLSLASGISYAFIKEDPNEAILLVLLALAYAYHGLRTMDKRSASGLTAAKTGAK